MPAKALWKEVRILKLEKANLENGRDLQSSDGLKRLQLTRAPDTQPQASRQFL